MTIWLPNLEDEVQLSGLLHGFLRFTGNVDIPHLALKHTDTQTNRYVQIHLGVKTLLFLTLRLHKHTQTQTGNKWAHVRSESLSSSLLPLQKPESLWKTFSFTLVETFEKEKKFE